MQQQQQHAYMQLQACLRAATCVQQEGRGKQGQAEGAGTPSSSYLEVLYFQFAFSANLKTLQYHYIPF
jgi:hypothetical protein